MEDRRQPTGPAGQFGPEVYATWRGSSLGEITEDLEQRLLLRLAGELHGRNVLDVGCGDGALTQAFVRGGAASVVGCDIDPRMISRAVSRATQEEQVVHYTVADTVDLPFADQSFDLVTVITVLAFVHDAEGAIREIARVLRPGGSLIIGDLAKWNSWAAWRRMRGWLGGAKTWRAATFRTATQLRGLARSAQLRVEHVSGAIFFPPWLPLARLLAPCDAALGEWTTQGPLSLRSGPAKSDRLFLRSLSIAYSSPVSSWPDLDLRNSVRSHKFPVIAIQFPCSPRIQSGPVVPNSAFFRGIGRRERSDS
jgi:ubiquinone/menaquinone biosynthesis C-methylase UbiE